MARIYKPKYAVLRKVTGVDLPPLPEPDAEGLTPAVEYGRILLARKIIRRRQALGLTQTALARKARIRQETLNRIERGKVNPDEKTLTKSIGALERLEKADSVRERK
jgi:DNA-binding XRE family transcriptional regulator